MIPKFRAYFHKYKRMIYSVGVVNENIILVDFNGYGNYEYLFLRNDIMLMQYSGLKDKKGNEIYEGDILHWIDSSKVGDDTLENKVVVYWDNEFLAWMVKGKYWIENTLPEYLFEYDKPGELEVIGNIYEDKR